MTITIFLCRVAFILTIAGTFWAAYEGDPVAIWWCQAIILVMAAVGFRSFMV